MLKKLKISDDEIVKMFRNNRRVCFIANDAGCSKTTIYRRMEYLHEVRKRKRSLTSPPTNMVYNIKPLEGYKNGIRML